MKYDVFDFFGKNIPEFSLWQSDAWKNILTKSGQAREVFYFGNPDSTFFLVEIRSVGAGFFGAFILWVKNFQIAEDFWKCFDALKNFLQKKWVIFIQIEPIEEISKFQKMSSKEVSRKFLTPFTRIISLADDAEKIIADMPQKGRYAIRNAEKKWVEIEIITNFSDEILDEWMKLLNETTTRDAFAHNSREYYKTFLQELWNDVFMVASKINGKYLAMTISVFSYDTALYYYGASTSDPEGRKLASSYLTLWESMKFSKNHGKRMYDLFGVADPNNSDDPLMGVSQFKQKLGGEIHELPKKFLIPISFKFSIYSLLLKIKKFLKK